ncbi:hypothetical protein GCM10011502_22810 [Oceanisphaera marina]|uniref:Uncharacterized protein n=1 Tax=Oceanisphaera marina TaxID=2017550 RepID=A0ABQ1IPZ5_9GAMM|nr:hypothetical protein GCM10011502_22810 [Oceanisphaera marina]
MGLQRMGQRMKDAALLLFTGIDYKGVLLVHWVLLVNDVIRFTPYAVSDNTALIFTHGVPLSSASVIQMYYRSAFYA